MSTTTSLQVGDEIFCTYPFSITRSFSPEELPYRAVVVGEPYYATGDVVVIGSTDDDVGLALNVCWLERVGTQMDEALCLRDLLIKKLPHMKDFLKPL